MTSLDLYDLLVKDVATECLPSDRQSRVSEAQLAQDEFQLQLRECKQLVGSIRDRNGDILRLKDGLMSNCRPEKEAQLSQQIQKICDQNYELVTKLRQGLIAATRIVEKLKKDLPNQPETFSKTFRKQHLAQEVENILRDTFSVQKLVQQFSIETNLKRIRLVIPDIDEQQARKLASSSNGLQQAVASKLTGKASLGLKYAHSDILKKAEGMVALQRAVEENLRLMREVGMLVQQQGEMIDNILKNVTEAKDYTGRTVGVLVQQKKQHKTSRKKICCIIFVAIGLLAALAIPIIKHYVNKPSQ